jgi:hypothetical protein
MPEAATARELTITRVFDGNGWAVQEIRPGDPDI